MSSAGRTHARTRMHLAVLVFVLPASMIAVAGGASRAATATTDPPNIVVILTDDMRLDQLAFMPTTQSRIGGEGTSFSNFVGNLPLCCPARATLLTGQYGFHHGVLRNRGVDGGYAAFDDTTALPVWLQGAGYRTIHVGKYLNGYGTGDAGEVPVGWDDWQGLLDLAYYDYRLNDNGAVVSYGASAADYSTDVLAGRAVDAIGESAPGGPFFLQLSVYAPHNDKEGGGYPLPIPAPRHEGAFASEPLPDQPSFNELDVSDKPAHIALSTRISTGVESQIDDRRRAQLESLLAVDEAVDQVVDALAATGELDNTVIMFTSDNGFMNGEHRVPSGKGYPYEESLALPLLARGPGFPAGGSVSALTATVDVAPTVAAIAGATPMLAVDGLDVRSVMAAPDAYADRAVVIESHDLPCYAGIRTADDVYVRYHSGEEELYDLAGDPFELTSLHADPAWAARKAELSALLDERYTGPPPTDCVTHPVIDVGDMTAMEPWSGKMLTARVPVLASMQPSTPVQVGYQVLAGTAGAKDAKLSSGTVSVGSISTWINVSIKADVLAEGTETLSVVLTPPDPLPGDVGFGRTTATVQILDRPPGSASVAVGDLAVPEWAGSVSVPVTLSDPPSTDVAIGYALVAGSASAGSDFRAGSGTVTVKAGTTTAHVALRTLSDDLEEVDEELTVTITAPEPHVVLRQPGTVTIVDNDGE